ncbi:Mannan endo-1,6-alpha-mannosidase DCW1 [Fulvia fulva]|uniref:Mannan endo-1,6-alpha-mannosidase n=1 Tax=Passalora fulva TaxID=5499 RepID=A0A9Q8PC18_PASFU|nr:Mannan endo-1,6-alpha-mannosidase DCW1 [Fulvia fulva]UJO19685.1 Mannan endo-1,6-alpha-mannosidase DCW1 [Fulvia fulva]
MRLTALLALPAALRLACAIVLDLNDQESIKSAARTTADTMMTWYFGNTTRPYAIPGLLPGPYYWWEAGAMFGSLIDYWYYTDDPSYNEVTTQGLLHQVGPDENYMPPNQSRTLGNDDQAFWGIAAMSAAEVGFPNPPPDQPQWLALAQAVFNTQVVRWDMRSCNGGLKWQIFTFNNGYNYKNSISNGCFFNLAARLSMYTYNATYAQWADTVWDWSVEVGLISEHYMIYDGTDDRLNCAEHDHTQWSYNAGVYLYGAAAMYNITSGAEQEKWRGRLESLLEATIRIFFQDQIMYEVACEPLSSCNIDQQTFKAYLSRWMAGTVKIVPWTHDIIMPLLSASAMAAARSCTGGDDGVTCGTKWTVSEWDGGFGVGQQMNALEVIQSNLIDLVPGPVSQDSGGTSVGNPNAGVESTGKYVQHDDITTADRAGAWILTAMVAVGICAGGWFVAS